MKVDAVNDFEKIKEILHDSSDLKSRTVQFFGRSAIICYIVEIIDNVLLNDTLIEPLLEYKPLEQEDPINALKDKSTPVKVDGLVLDDESRELLLASLENSLKMGQLISAQKKRG